MAKLTLADLRKMREEKQKALDMRDSSNKDIQVVVGMGTCGIAAGAKDTFTALINTLSEKGKDFALKPKVLGRKGVLKYPFLLTYNILEK